MPECYYQSPVGVLSLSSEGGFLTAVRFVDESRKIIFPEKPTDDSVLLRAVEWLDRYFGGLRPQPDELPLNPRGSEFQKTVWAYLCKIPYGKTVSYGSLASTVAGDGQRRLARAVGGAAHRNPIAIIIPCHRVIGSDGSLTGYGGGVERKALLLRLEGVDIPSVTMLFFENT